MKLDTLHLYIVTTERTVYDDDVDAVTVMTADGEITVLPHHTPLVSVLKAGEMRITKNGEVIPLATASGILEIQPGSRMVVLADAAEAAEAIDPERAEKAYERAREAMERKEHISDVEYARLQATLEKNLNRMNVRRKYRG